jgi:hypothetical protein
MHGKREAAMAKMIEMEGRRRQHLEGIDPGGCRSDDTGRLPGLALFTSLLSKSEPAGGLYRRTESLPSLKMLTIRRAGHPLKN